MKKEYKEYFDEISPSVELVEGLFEERSRNSGFKVKPLLACALCLVLAATCCSIGFAHNAKDDYISSTTQETTISNTQTKNIGTVLIAYAAESEFVKVEDLSMLQAPIFCNLTVIDKNAPEAEINEKKAKYKEICNQTEARFNEIGDQGKGIGMHCTEDQWDNAEIYMCRLGEFIIDIDDYSKVDNITLYTQSEYGEMEICVMPYENEYDGNTLHQSFRNGNKVVVSGEDLLKSQQYGHFEMGIGENQINTGCQITWKYSDALGEAINADPDFDLTQIEDMITFEVKYTNGDMSKVTINISFDEDGNMQLQNGTYNYYTK